MSDSESLRSDYNSLPELLDSLPERVDPLSWRADPGITCEPNMAERFGNYELLEELATGGMGKVFRARIQGAKGFEKVVALKFMLPRQALSARSKELFIAEARLASTLSHANIVGILDFGERGGNYFIAMEYVSGVNLGAALARSREKGQPMTPVVAAYIAAQAARGLDYAHKKTDEEGRPLGIVHRDISPQNLVLSWAGEVKILDFGIAQSELTRVAPDPTVVQGKFPYLSPEQALAEPVDHRADLFSLGSILYELLTGNRAFPQRGMQAAIAVARAEFPRPDRVRPDLPTGLVTVILRAMTRLPADRYPSAGAMVEDLSLWLAQARTRGQREDEAAALTRWLGGLFDRKPAAPGAGASMPELTWSEPSGGMAAEESVNLAELREKTGLFVPTVPVPRMDRPSGSRMMTSPPAEIAPPWWRTWPVLFGAGGVLAGVAALVTGLALSQRASPTPTATPAVALAPTPTATEAVATATAAPSATPVVTAPVRTGLLRVSSVPSGAAVFLDGKEVAEAPIPIPDLPVPASYLVEVKKEGFAPWSKEVDLPDDQAVEVVATLVPPDDPGKVTFHVPAGATALLDGHPVGTGPVTVDVESQPGRRQVRLKDAHGKVYKDFILELAPRQSAEPDLPDPPGTR